MKKRSSKRDEKILKAFLKECREELENDMLAIFDSMDEENMENVLIEIRKYSKKNIVEALVKISKLRPAQSDLYCNFIHQLLHLHENSEGIDKTDPKVEELDSWKGTILEFFPNFPAPIVRLLYENGDFTLDECLCNIDISGTTGFADIIPDFYFFAKDYPQIKLTRDWIITGCMPGSINSLIKADDIDSIKSIIDENFDFDSYLRKPYFECKFYYYDHLLKGVKRTPLNVAAFYGAVKCFKYFLLIGSKITSDTARMAVAGGNLEIFRICEQTGVNLDGCEKIAADFCRFNLMKWFTEVREKSAYSYNYASSVLNVKSDQLDRSVYVSSRHLLLKLIEEKKNLRNHELPNLFNKNDPEEIYIPIARALLARGFDPINVFTLGCSDKLFEYAMEIADVKMALKKKPIRMAFVISKLGDELFEKFEEFFNDIDFFNSIVFCLAINDKNEERLYKVIEKNPSWVKSSNWEKVIEYSHKSCFKLIPPDSKMTLNIKQHCRNSEIDDLIAFYKSLPDGIRLSHKYCSHPKLFFDLKDRLESLEIEGYDLYNMFAIKQLGGTTIYFNCIEAQMYDTWCLIANYFEKYITI